MTKAPLRRGAFRECIHQLLAVDRYPLIRHFSDLFYLVGATLLILGVIVFAVIKPVKCWRKTKKQVDLSEAKKEKIMSDEIKIDVDIEDMQWEVETEAAEPDVIIDDGAEDIGDFTAENSNVTAERIYNKHLFTWVFSFLLGFYGVDRFVRGQIFLGVVKILTFGGLGFWYMTDFIIAAVKSYGTAFGNTEDIAFDAEGHYLR